MIIVILLVLVCYCVFTIHKEVKPASLSKVSRSRSMTPRPDTSFCGNCHGTGDEGFGIMPDSAGDCEACDGRGYIKIDPNAKYMTLKEALAFAERATAKEEK